MTTDNLDLWGYAGAATISFISGFITIARRILNGHPASILWVLTEAATAVLSGCLTYHAYPVLQPSLPDWVTLPVAVAIAAHVGGRVFQELEGLFMRRVRAKFPEK